MYIPNRSVSVTSSSLSSVDQNNDGGGIGYYGGTGQRYPRASGEASSYRSESDLQSSERTESGLSQSSRTDAYIDDEEKLIQAVLNPINMA